MKDRDNTFLMIGIFLTVVILIIMGLYALFKEVSAQDVLYSILAICALDVLCFLTHRAFNMKK